MNELFPPTPESGCVPTTSPMVSNQEGQENGNDNEMVGNHPKDIGVIYNASLVEPALDIDGDIVEDDNAIWQQHENPKEDYCEFSFLVSLQQIQKYRNHPEEAVALIANAAKKSHAEVSCKNV